MGNNLCRFGVMEFALVTSLNFGKMSSADNLKEHLTNDRIGKECFNCEVKVSFGKLEDALKECTDPEDAFKLGLCYLIEGVLYAYEKTTNIWGDVLKLVEDLD